MKPKIGETIYYLCEDQIIAYTVAFLGDESFIVDEYKYIITGEFEYSDFNVVWFKNLKKAFAALRRKYGRKINIVHDVPFMWEVEEKD